MSPKVRDDSQESVQSPRHGDAVASLLSAIVQSSHDAIISKTLEGKVTSWNPAAEKIFGYTAAEMIGQSIRVIIPPELQAEEDYVLDKIRRGETIDHFDTTRLTKSGGRVSVLLTVSPILNSDGEVIGASKIARDITYRKRLEFLLSAVVNSSDDAIISKDLNGVITSWNAGAERIFGYSAREVIGKSLRLIIPPERQAEEDYVLDQIRRGDRIDHFETVRMTRDGRRINVSVTSSPIRNAQGVVVGASKIARDITDRTRLEALLSSIIASSDDAIVSKTLDGIVTSWNAAAERMFGYTAQEMIGQSIRRIIPVELQTEEDYVLGQLRRGLKVDHFETVRQTKDGRRLNISLTVSPIKDAEGVVVGASKIARDITEKIEMEQQRETALEKLAEAVNSRDEFIAIAAHELRNPLNVMTLLFRVLQRTTGSSAPGASLIENARGQLARLSSLLDRLLDVSRIRSGTFDLYPEKVELTSVIQEVVRRCAMDKPSSTIETRLESPVEGIWDRLRIDQVITNLVSNAIKFGEGKPVRVGVSADGNEAVITVSDEGIGISGENVNRVFERFERGDARMSSEGMGLGLWIASQIVKAHNGTIAVESELGKGSTFTVRLPIGK